MEEAAEIENRPMSGSKIVGQSTQNSDKVDRADRDAPCETGKTVSKSALSSSCALLGGHDESGSLLISASQLQLLLDTAAEKAVNSLGSSGKGKSQISSCIYSSGESIQKAEMHATEIQSLGSEPCVSKKSGSREQKRRYSYPQELQSVVVDVAKKLIVSEYTWYSKLSAMWSSIVTPHGYEGIPIPAYATVYGWVSGPKVISKKRKLLDFCE